VQDERLVQAICDTNKASAKTYLSAPATPLGGRSASDLISTSENSDPHDNLEDAFVDAETFEDENMRSISDGITLSEGTTTPKIYGAQQRNVIIDARPTVNAIANRAAGMGSEDMEYYRCATKAYLGIDNIHVMRKSLLEVVEALKDSDITPLPPNREQLAKSGWLKHIANMLDGAALIARTVGIYHSHVLIHCSDGWDRTSQLSALGQLCLDPYFRTLEGFIVLVEKDWLSFGHMFRHRSGLLGSEKWFDIENERIGGGSGRSGSNGTPGTGGAGNAFESALSRAKGFFHQQNSSHDSLSDEDSDMQPQDSPFSLAKRSSAKPQAEDKLVTKVKETSPVFHQFLDATYQLMYQHPTRFEFNERFLRRLLYHLYSCQYGTFLYDNEKERVESQAPERTRSVWDYFLSRKEQFLNDRYDAEVDDMVLGKERIIFPRKEHVRWWAEIFGRSDTEMNGPAPTVKSMVEEQRLQLEIESSTLTGVENAEEARGLGSVRKATPSPGPGLGRRNSNGNLGTAAHAAGERIVAGLAAMALGRNSAISSRPRSPTGLEEREMMEVEMQ